MGDELKVYLPPLVQPVLRLFLQDQSEQKMATQKVLLTAANAIAAARIQSQSVTQPSYENRTVFRVSTLIYIFMRRWPL